MTRWRIYLFFCFSLLFSRFALADPVLLLTEHLPPYQIVGQQDVTGSSAEITKAVFEHADIAYDMTASGWSDAYKLTLRNPNACLFSTSRIEERESSFVWIGQINSMNTAFYRSVNHDFTVSSLEDVKNYRVAAIKDDVSHHFLVSKGFEVDKNLYVLHAYDSLLDLLDRSNRRIDLVLLNPKLLAYRVKDKRRLSRYEKVMQLEELTLYHYLACNIGAGPEMVASLVTSFAQLEASGHLQSIRTTWGIDSMQAWGGQEQQDHKSFSISSSSCSLRLPVWISN